MKTLHLFFVRCFLIIALMTLVGCATTSSSSGEPHQNQWTEMAKEWEDATPLERAKGILFWPFVYGALYGAQALASH
jgi:hypothetical protein